MKFSDLGLGNRICNVLDECGFVAPTDIQSQAIPEVVAGNDVLGIAQTGTGKTGAFCLPIVERLFQQGKKAKAKPKQVTTLILAPTRELAGQILNEAKRYSVDSWIRSGVVTGGVNQRPQERMLSKGVDILVATPGRLLDLAGSGYVDLGRVSFLVLDEADQLLDMGFIRDLRRIVKLLPPKRQTLLFSATMPKAVEQFAADILHQPVRVEVTPETVTVEKIEQGHLKVATEAKQSALLSLLRQPEVRKAIVFTRTKHGANRVAKKLDKQDVGVDVIHGNKSQNARNKALDRFKQGDAWVLVATDVAARGIDIRDVTHVINFELPHEPEVYVHRIGRTARAGACGVAWSLVAQDERGRLKAIEKMTRVTVPELAVDIEGDGEVIPVKSEDSQASENPRRRSRRRRNRSRNRKKAA